MTNEKQSGRRNVTGIVISDRMDKTVTVQVTRLVKHPRYRKYVKRSKNYKAHDENNECRINDTVVLEECRPLSKTKRWTVVQRSGLE
ncbi:MAG: 30S ribosomal protein S17 [Proteobacteria bacterium]|nr:30S ribosomal protein S17 [Pseudomonadota bacterium]